MIKKVLGCLYETDQFVAQKPKYSSENLFFDRFCYDIVSLLGSNIYKFNLVDIEFIFRKTYFTLSHSFGPNKGGIKLLDIDSIIHSPFDASFLQRMEKATEETTTPFQSNKMGTTVRSRSRMNNSKPSPDQSAMNSIASAS